MAAMKIVANETVRLLAVYKAHSLRGALCALVFSGPPPRPPHHFFMRNSSIAGCGKFFGLVELGIKLRHAVAMVVRPNFDTHRFDFPRQWIFVNEIFWVKPTGSMPCSTSSSRRFFQRESMA
jgi:hypothetical protein